MIDQQTQVDLVKLKVSGAASTLASIALKAKSLQIAYDIDEKNTEFFFVWVNPLTAEHDALITFMDQNGVDYEPS